jgi:hypothetical protein
MGNRSLVISLLVIGLGLTACGEGMVGRGLGSTKVGGVSISEPKVDFEQIDSQTKAAEDALAEANLAIENAVPTSGIFSGGGSVSIQSLTGIAEKLEEKLNLLLSKASIPLQKARDILNLARMQVVSAMAKLDPNNPAHLEMIARLEQALAKLDEADARVRSALQLAASKIDIITTQIDALIAKMDPSNPLYLLPIFELEELKRVIIAFQTKLANL